ncbi:MAG: plasmid pRiA4b ORF-3 family protein [Phycisphaerales bacterium]|nr:plasmid pRiA4b ORF-3 family protein [Phycisphaerales bacterium]
MSTMMQLRAWLVDSEPEVWRRLVVDPRLTLEQLHSVLQHAFGWTNSHMHQFHEKDGTCYARPAPRGFDLGFGTDKPTIDERNVLLADVFDRPKKTIAYEYDFGDSWVHAVRFEKMVESQALEYPGETFVTKGKGVFSGKERAAICLAGARNGPPEDCGGLYGYQHILELKAEPPHPTAGNDADSRELLEWIGDWDPDRFDLAEVNQLLGRVRVKKAHKG